MMKQVRRGIAQLDQKLVEFCWYEKIALSKLLISSSCLCVLGQLFGTYEQGRVELSLSDSDVRKHGFYISKKIKPTSRNWKMLNRCWKIAIQEKLSQNRQLPHCIQVAKSHPTEVVTSA